MSIEANKALVRRAIGYNHGSVDNAREIFATDFVAYMPGQPPLDRGAFEQFVDAVADGQALGRRPANGSRLIGIAADARLGRPPRAGDMSAGQLV